MKPANKREDRKDRRLRRKCAAAFRERVLRSDIVLVTHNSRTIRQYCHRAAILADGQLRLFEDVGSALDSYRISGMPR